MSTSITLFRGETRVFTVTVTDPVTGALADLSTGTWQVVTLEFQVKVALEAADPPLINKSLGNGVTLLSQSGETLGQFTIHLAPGDTAGPGTPPGRYFYDVVTTLASGARVYFVRPSVCQVMGVVNQL